jgi:carboxylesterase type B
MKRTLPVLLLGVAILASTQLRAAINDPVKTDAGLLSGTVQEGVRVFKGIPFGAPPVGALRWREPQPVAKWDGVRKADKYGDVCMQNPAKQRFPPNSATDLPDSPGMSEDCLYLNVWTNASNASAKQPVLLWVYGGAYTEGAGSMPLQDGAALAKKGVIIVTYNYRLGAFGFYSHPELDAESGHNASGNQALLDTVAALKWIQANIANFGGDPKNVTVFGESAGACISAAMVGSPLAAGMINRAISESGAYMGLAMGRMQTRQAIYNPAPRGGGGRPGGAPAGGGGRPGGAPPAPLPTTLAELRALPAAEVQSRMRGSGMIVDGYVVPEDFSLTFAAGRQNAVDVLVGSNKDEGGYQPTRMITVAQYEQQVRQQYGELADEFLKANPAATDEEASEKARRHPLSRAPVCRSDGEEGQEGVGVLLRSGGGAVCGPARVQGRSRRRDQVRVQQLEQAADLPGQQRHRVRLEEPGRYQGGRSDVELLGELRQDGRPERQGVAHVAGVQGQGDQPGKRDRYHDARAEPGPDGRLRQGVREEHHDAAARDRGDEISAKCEVRSRSAKSKCEVGRVRRREPAAWGRE